MSAGLYMLGFGPELGRQMTFSKTIMFPLRTAWAVANRMGWMGQPQIGNQPHLDPEALERWRTAIRRTNVYLEYGSGGSTVEATRHARHVFSVETDERYLSAVERRVRSGSEPRAQFHPVPIYVGWTEKWGRPLLAGHSSARLHMWQQYSSKPWEALDSLGLVPDFIFVDGRFRAASVLESFLRLPDGADCLFMLDDFVGRERNYGAVQEFAVSVETVGRAITFRRGAKFDRATCKRLLRQYQADPE